MICKYYMWELIDFEQFLLVSVRMDGSMPCILISIECLAITICLELHRYQEEFYL